MMYSNKDLSSYSSLDRLSLKADCESCFGLCCVALPFSASIDFALDKDAGKPCEQLQADYRCGIHNDLRQLGFRGCTVYECFGAGQKVSQATYGGQDWRHNPASAKQMYEVFPLMWQLHELLWYLTEALTWQPAQQIYKDLIVALQETERLTNLSPDSLLELDVSAHRSRINILLLQTSELVRDNAKRKHQNPPLQQIADGRGVDLIGANLKGADLRYANLRGAYLIATDLRGADLRMTDLIGADFRDADIRGADLSNSIFLTQMQLNAAKGDINTKIPLALTRPIHWKGSSIQQSKELER